MNTMQQNFIFNKDIKKIKRQHLCLLHHHGTHFGKGEFIVTLYNSTLLCMSPRKVDLTIWETMICKWKRCYWESMMWIGSRVLQSCYLSKKAVEEILGEMISSPSAFLRTLCDYEVGGHGSSGVLKWERFP